LTILLLGRVVRRAGRCHAILLTTKARLDNARAAKELPADVRQSPSPGVERNDAAILARPAVAM
jgi:hypothetical protein